MEPHRDRLYCLSSLSVTKSLPSGAAVEDYSDVNFLTTSVLSDSPLFQPKILRVSIFLFFNTHTIYIQDSVFENLRSFKFYTPESKN